VLLNGLNHLVLICGINITQLAIDFAVLLLEHALSLLNILDERCLFLFNKDRRLDKLLTPICEIPNKDAL
jgi:hypothetical protein